MFDTFMTSLKYSFVEKGNMTLYYLSKLPLIGRKVVYKFYKETNGKIIFGTIGFFFNCIYRLFCKSFFLTLFIFLPSHFINDWKGTNSVEKLVLQSFVVLCFVIGSLLNSAVFNEDDESYKMIKVMRMNPKKYYIVKIITRVIVDFIGFIIFFSIFKVANPLILILELSFCRIIGEYLDIILFHKFDLVLIGNSAAVVFLAIIALVFGYGFGIVGLVFDFKVLIENLITFFVLLFLSVICFYKILKFNDYKAISIKVAVKRETGSKSELNRDMNFSNVELKSVHGKLLDSSKFNNKTGYEYLNSIFFFRNNKIVKRFIIFKCILITIVFIFLAALLKFFVDQDINDMFDDIKNISPILVFFMYLLSSTEKISKSMFFNCDISLLRYGFYKRPKDILNNFTSRIKKIMLYNSIHTVVLVGELSIFIIFLGLKDRFIEIIPILILIITLSCFFTIYSVFMYYILQPYTKDLEIKNPIFKIVNYSMYAVCYGCSKIKTTPQYFTIGVIIFTVICIPIFFGIVYKYAPKTFKLK